MITAIVQFSLPKPISLEEATRAFESTAPKYQGLRGSCANIICAARTAAKPAASKRSLKLAGSHIRK